MSNITYANKSQTASYDAAQWNAQDANEVKTAVNSKSDTGHTHAVSDITGFNAAALSAAPAETATSIGGVTNGATSKGTPVDADQMLVSDSAASFAGKKVSWANIKATLLSYFNGVYQAALISGNNIKTINSTSLLGSGNIVAGGGTVDTTVTDGSTNAVSGNAVYDMFQSTTIYFSTTGFKGQFTDDHDSTWLAANPVGSVNNPLMPIGGESSLTQLSTPTLTATVASDTQINLSWTNVSNETSYKIEWSANGTTGWTQIGGTIAANTTTYNHTPLTASTHYYYRISAIGDGTTYSTSGFGTDDDTTSATSGGAAYLTWTTIGSDMEQYNTSKGIRKKTTGSSGWSTPTRAASSALAVETLSIGQSVIVKVGSPSLATMIIVSSTTTPDAGGTPLTGVNYGIYAGYGLTANAMAQQNNLDYGSSSAIAVGDLLKITYGANMVFEKSTNSGSSWTTIATGNIAPSGTYYLIVQSYSPLGGFDEIYK